MWYGFEFIITTLHSLDYLLGLTFIKPLQINKLSKRPSHFQYGIYDQNNGGRDDGEMKFKYYFVSKFLDRKLLGQFFFFFYG